MGTRGLRLGALVSAIALVSVLGILSPAAAAPRDDYPSWDEVEVARGDQAAAESTIARIDALLSALVPEGIYSRSSTPCGAWEHSQTTGWY